MTKRRWLLPVIILGATLFVTLMWSLLGVFFRPNPTALTTQVLRPSRELQSLTVQSSAIIAIRQTAEARGPLLLFLPATGTSTRMYQLFEDVAARHGYHVIALPYANRRTETSICTDNANCYGQLHNQQFSGYPSPYLNESPSSAVIPTLLSTLATLNKRDPSGHWNRYLKNSHTLTWNNIVVAGHSQGGGLAAYIAHQRTVKGVIMFSSPNDIYFKTHTVAAWLQQPNATQAKRYYGFFDIHDHYAKSTQVSWKTMFPSLSIHNVASPGPLKGNFLSSPLVHFPNRLSAHFAAANDPTYVPVWQYLLTKAKS